MRQNSGTNEPLRGVFFLDNQTGWAVGGEAQGTAGLIFKTTNGGATWVRQAAPSPSSLDSVYFINSSTGWAVGCRGSMLKTTDGGATWVRQTPGSTEWLFEVLFVDSIHGWVVGDGGTILYTDDAGATWTPQSSGTAGFLSGVAFSDPAHGWAVGSYGTILKAPSDGGRVVQRTSISLSSGSSSPLPYGSTFSIEGILKGGGTGLSGQSVILQSAAPGGAYTDTSLRVVTAADGTFTFSVKPMRKTRYRVRFAGDAEYSPSVAAAISVTPRAWVGTPKAPLTMSRTGYRTVYGYLMPRHRSGTYPVRIYCWKQTASGSWKSYGYVKAKATNYDNYSKYAKSMGLPYRGKWRLRAYAPADSLHGAAWSSGYDYVMVK